MFVILYAVLLVPTCFSHQTTNFVEYNFNATTPNIDPSIVEDAKATTV